jgi:hypothetical protein
MRPPALAVCLALLCVLAGCNAFTPGASGDDGVVAPDVTPAEVPRDMAGGTLAPGLTDEGIVDADALFAAHLDAVENESVTLDLTLRQRTDETLRRSSTATYRYGPGWNRTLFEVRTGGDERSPYDRLARWTNASVSYERTVVGNTTAYSRQRLDDRGRGSLIDYRLDRLNQTLRSTTVESVRYDGTSDGRRQYVVEGTIAQSSRRCTGDGDTVEAASSFRFVVDERGVVGAHERTRLQCRPVGDGQVNETVLDRTVYRNLGETTADRPEWVADARERIADREYVAPGVTTERVVDPAALHRAHERAVRNRSLRAERTSVERRNGTVVAEDRHVLAVNRTSERSLVRVYGGGDLVRATWANGTVGYRRVGDGGDGSEVDYQRLPDPDPRRTVGRYLDVEVPLSAQYVDATVERLDDGRHRVTVTNLTLDYYSGRAYDRVSFVVGEDGLVTRYEAVGVGTTVRGDEGVETTVRFAVTETGTVRVERPGWLPAAANATDRS